MSRMSARLLPVIAAAAAMLSMPAHAEVYRCMVDGVPKFTDKPCRAGAEPVDVPQATVVPAEDVESLVKQHDARVRAYQKARDADDAAWGDEYAARLATEARIRDARIHGQVVAGMQAGDVRRLLGDPLRISTSDNASRRLETWYYNDNEHGRVSVTLQDDTVISVRSSKSRSQR